MNIDWNYGNFIVKVSVKLSLIRTEVKRKINDRSDLFFVVNITVHKSRRYKLLQVIMVSHCSDSSQSIYASPFFDLPAVFFELPVNNSLLSSSFSCLLNLLVAQVFFPES